MVDNERAAEYLRIAAQNRIIDLDKEIEEIEVRVDWNQKQMDFDTHYLKELLAERVALAEFLGVVF